MTPTLQIIRLDRCDLDWQSGIEQMEDAETGERIQMRVYSCGFSGTCLFLARLCHVKLQQEGQYERVSVQ